MLSFGFTLEPAGRLCARTSRVPFFWVVKAKWKNYSEHKQQQQEQSKNLICNNNKRKREKTSRAKQSKLCKPDQVVFLFIYPVAFLFEFACRVWRWRRSQTERFITLTQICAGAWRSSAAANETPLPLTSCIYPIYCAPRSWLGSFCSILYLWRP